MKRLLIVLSLLFTSVMCGCSAMQLKGKELIGQPAPEARLMLFDGSEIPLSSQLGRNTAIVFWATWCRHSKSLIASYEELAKRYSKRGDIDFFAVSVDKNDDFKILKERIKSQGLLSMNHFFSGNEAQDHAFISLEGQRIPYVVFIDSLGVVRLVEGDITPLQEYLELQFGH